MWQGDVLKAFLLRHRFDIVSITWVIELKHSTEERSSAESEGLVVAWVVLHRKSPHWS